ncbi:MAG: metalloregulator ArsR/SmtB family transcription factor [Bacteroidales bacterium]|nr:metalloregulator ArsR/SmtB family transcription factor [Bacteroidales bacterium]MCF8402339.1 metalloregulator ArsR/SmtB family transcription factor [Bacteroidales bacterium]
MTYTKSEAFQTELKDVAKFAKVLSHPARLAILQHLSRCCTCKSGDIANELPLSRTTVSQHLQELKNLGLVKYETNGVTVCYEVDVEMLMQYKQVMDAFFNESLHELTCGCK